VRHELTPEAGAAALDERADRMLEKRRELVATGALP